MCESLETRRRPTFGKIKCAGPSVLRASIISHHSDSRGDETTSITTHSHGQPPIDTTLSPAPGPSAPAPPSPRLPPATLPHERPPCVHYPQRSLRRIPKTAGSTAKQRSTRNTTARQIPTAIAQQARPEPQPREQDLWRARIRGRQEAHGDEEIPQHDESRGHLLALVPAQPGHPSLDNNGAISSPMPPYHPKANPALPTGHTRLPRHSSMVHGLYLQDRLRPLAPLAQRFPATSL